MWLLIFPTICDAYFPVHIPICSFFISSSSCFLSQDAHEFLNYLLNELVEILEKESRAAKSDAEVSPPSEKITNGPTSVNANGAQKEPLVTWVHKNFQVCCLSAYVVFLHYVSLYKRRLILCFPSLSP